MANIWQQRYSSRDISPGWKFRTLKSSTAEPSQPVTHPLTLTVSRIRWNRPTEKHSPRVKHPRTGRTQNPKRSQCEPLYHCIIRQGEGYSGRNIAANGNAEASSYGADGDCSAASDLADPACQSDSGAPGGDAGEVPEHAKEGVRTRARHTASCSRRRMLMWMGPRAGTVIRSRWWSDRLDLSRISRFITAWLNLEMRCSGIGRRGSV
jgi:hypothetical protein